MNGGKCTWILLGISIMLAPGILEGRLLQNAALNKIAVQSSGSDAGRAVDGNRDPEFARNSCSFTKEETSPWWRVDLQNVYKIRAVMITNTDAGGGLDGAEIWIGNSIEANGTKNIRCTVISHIPRGRTLYFPCSTLEGRYVTVLLPGHNQILGLCEVEVYTVDYVYPLSNVALRGNATQSSTLSFATASKAIDGQRDSFYGRGFCSHTAEDETNPWWRVDLGGTYTVISVKVTNRGDCCAERLDGAEIRVGSSQENNGNNNPRCAVIAHIRAGKTYTYHCDGGSMDGRFVNIVIPGTRKTLTLCEVEVYAAPTVKPLPNVVLGGTTTQSTALNAFNDGGGCSLYFNYVCCRWPTHTNPFPSVRQAAPHKISGVIIFNPNNHDAKSLFEEQIHIRNSNFYSNRHTCQDVYMHTYTFACAKLRGEYVQVIILGDSQTLTHCEVTYAVSAAPTVSHTPHLTPSPPTVSVPLNNRSVTAVGARLCWTDALLYCRHHHWDLLSLHGEDEQSLVEQLLHHTSLPLTDGVWLGLRSNLARNMWFWMSGESMTFTKWPQDSAPSVNSNRCGAMESGELHLWQDQPCEERLNFICQSRPADQAERVYFYSTRKLLTYA